MTEKGKQRTDQLNTRLLFKEINRRRKYSYQKKKKKHKTHTKEIPIAECCHDDHMRQIREYCTRLSRLQQAQGLSSLTVGAGGCRTGKIDLSK